MASARAKVKVEWIGGGDTEIVLSAAHAPCPSSAECSHKRAYGGARVAFTTACVTHISELKRMFSTVVLMNRELMKDGK